jgi:Cu/Ag efflux protein CusF
MNRLPKWLHLSLGLALVLVVTGPALAAVKIKSVNADQKQITVTDQDNKDWTYTLTDNAKIFLPDNKEGKLNDLKAGQNISLLWEKRGDHYFTNAILLQEGDLRDAMLTEGTVKRVNAGQNEVVVSDKNNKDWTYHLMDNAKVSVGTRTGKLTDLKDGNQVVIVYQKKDNTYQVRDICTQR